MSEVLQPGDDGVIRFGDVDGVGNDAARMGYPLPADHELILGIVAEGIAHAAVPPGNAHTAAHRVQQSLFLLAGDLAHGPHRHNEAQRLHILFFEVDIQRIGDTHLIPLRL